MASLKNSLHDSLRNFSKEDAQIISIHVEKLSPDLVTKLESLFEADNPEQAYINIGVSSGPGAWGADALREGKRLFNHYRLELQKEICSYKPLRLYCENSNTVDLISAAAIILGKLLEIYTAGIDVVSVAYLISKVGIKSFCKVHWQMYTEG